MRRWLVGCVAVFAVIVFGAVALGEWRSAEDVTLDAAARAAAPGSFVTLPQGVTHYHLSGPDSGRVVVLVHGFSVPYYIWDSTVAELSTRGYRVLRYDLYGRGFSDRPRVRYDAALYDGQLVALLDSLRIPGPIDLIGLSFGGYVVAHFVTHHPLRVRTLTLVDPMSRRPGVPGVMRLPLVGPWLWKVAVVPGMAEGQMTDFLHPERFPDWADRYRPQMRYRGFGRALRSTLLEASRTHFDSLYAGVAGTGVPVLLVWGKQDQTVPFELSEVVLRNIPSLEFVPVDSSGHLPHIEQARLVNERLVDFFEAHPGR